MCIALTLDSWPCRTTGLAVQSLAVRSHIRTVPSRLPVTTQWLSGLIPIRISTLLLAGSDVLQGRVSEQRLKLSSLLRRALDHPGSGRECVRLLIGRPRLRRLSRY